MQGDGNAGCSSGIREAPGHCNKQDTIIEFKFMSQGDGNADCSSGSREAATAALSPGYRIRGTMQVRGKD